MTGHVFHPGHAELHGITVVLETKGSLTYVGRYDSEDAQGVHLLDVGVHDAAAGGLSREAYVARSAKLGVRSDQKHVLVPAVQVLRIIRLAEVS